ncbi:MAG: hypothetical protein OXM61_00535 [Candidatus Poribacteria bacterium]|nr:hypothetical protein [Candidatus Poribacteria bacterium]
MPRRLFVHKTYNGYFTGKENHKKEVSTEQLARLFQNRSQARSTPFDKLCVPNTNQDTLKDPLYRRFITESAAENEIEDLLLKDVYLSRKVRRYVHLLPVSCCVMTNPMTTFTTVAFKPLCIGAEIRMQTTRLILRTIQDPWTNRL